MARLFVIGAALGGAAMYLLDPQQGRRRRARLRDQAVRAQNEVKHTLEAGKRDLAARATATKGRIRSLFRKRSTTDHVLEERVRSKMGRYVMHPGAIEVAAAGGDVVLSGSILSHERDDLLEAIAQVAGVKDVIDQLSVYETAEGISELQGSRSRRERSGALQESWAPSSRVAAGAAGTVLALLAPRGGFKGLLYATAGTLLLVRSATNKPLRAIAGLSGEDLVDVEKTIEIDAPAEQVFEYLANYENFPQFMRNVKSVQTKVDGRSHWVVAGPAGTSIEFESYVIDLVPNEVIAWSSVEGSLQHSGTIRLQPSDSGTRVHIRMSYTPPAGIVGHAVAKLFGADLKSELDEDMMRLKSTLETGRPPRDAAAAWQGSASPAQPA